MKQANSKLAQEKTALQKQMDVLRGVEPGAVLSRLFKAKGPYKKEGQQYYILPDKREISVNDSRWNADGQQGKGAIDLVMVLRGYKTCPWVIWCISALARAPASLPPYGF